MDRPRTGSANRSYLGFVIAFVIHLALRGLSSERKKDASTHSTFA